MNVKEMADILGLDQITAASEDRQITGVYACDFLSRVMSGCEKGNIWITVQTHPNVLSVAEINEAACVIVPENVKVGPGMIEKALDKNIAIFSSSMTAYELCWRLHELEDKFA